MRHLGHDAAASVASSEGTGLDPRKLQDAALELAQVNPADEESRSLFSEGVTSHLELQLGFRRLQWARFTNFHKIASAYRLAQRKITSSFYVHM